jgi:hypothetical protein
VSCLGVCDFVSFLVYEIEKSNTERQTNLDGSAIAVPTASNQLFACFSLIKKGLQKQLAEGRCPWQGAGCGGNGLFMRPVPGI